MLSSMILPIAITPTLVVTPLTIRCIQVDWCLAILRVPMDV